MKKILLLLTILYSSLFSVSVLADGHISADAIENANPIGQSILQGEGAGPGPTSSALMSDLLSILRGNIKFPFGISDKKRKKVKKPMSLTHLY